MAWLRAVASFQVFRGGRCSVFGDNRTAPANTRLRESLTFATVFVPCNELTLNSE